MFFCAFPVAPVVSIQGIDKSWHVGQEDVKFVCSARSNPPAHLFTWIRSVSPKNGWNTGCNVQGKGQTFSRVSVNSHVCTDLESFETKHLSFTTAGVSWKWTSSGDLSATGLKISSLKTQESHRSKLGGLSKQSWRAKAACQRWDYLWSHIWAETLELSNARFIHRDSPL